MQFQYDTLVQFGDIARLLRARALDERDLALDAARELFVPREIGNDDRLGAAGDGAAHRGAAAGELLDAVIGKDVFAGGTVGGKVRKRCKKRRKRSVKTRKYVKKDQKTNIICAPDDGVHEVQLRNRADDVEPLRSDDNIVIVIAAFRRDRRHRLVRVLQLPHALKELAVKLVLVKSRGRYWLAAGFVLLIKHAHERHRIILAMGIKTRKMHKILRTTS